MQIGSSDSSSSSTPEPHSYHPHSFGPDVPYPVALPSTPYVHDYENQYMHGPETIQTRKHEYQRTYPPNDSVNTSIVSPRSLPFRLSTSSEFLSPVATPQVYVRRRSLSHSDIGQLIQIPPNPTLVRLRERRARSTTPEEKQRPGPYPTHGRTTSGGRSRDRPVQARSMSRGNASIKKATSMHTGTFLDPHNETVSEAKADYDPLLDDDFFLNHVLSTEHNGPAIRHMTNLHELERSRQIIEIGAMSAVTRPNHANVDQSLGETELECILKKVEDVERHLRKINAVPEVLEACTIIREALAWETTTDKRDKNVGAESRVELDALEAPTKVLSAEDWGAYIGDEDESGITAMMMMEHEEDFANE